METKTILFIVGAAAAGYFIGDSMAKAKYQKQYYDAMVKNGVSGTDAGKIINSVGLGLSVAKQGFGFVTDIIDAFKKPATTTTNTNQLPNNTGQIV